LDAAVARAQGVLVEVDEPGCTKGDLKKLRKEFRGPVVRWYSRGGAVGGWEPLKNRGSPSFDWAVGGPIVEDERIAICFAADGSGWLASHPAKDGWGHCSTAPLIAAMRAFVASKSCES
jgi:hypothetical protein